MSNYDDMILGEGDEARRKAEEKTDRNKTNYLKLKDGESMKGWLLSADFVAYMNHNDFEKRIKSHPCTDPKHGKACISCQHGVKRSKKLLVPFYDAAASKVVVFDAAPKQVKVVYAFIDQYGEDAIDTPIVFTRSGEETATTYSLMPLPPKAAKELGAKPEVEITREFWESVLAAPDEDYVRELIGATAGASDDSTPLEISDDDLPF